jgi:hypothetical protein
MKDQVRLRSVRALVGRSDDGNRLQPGFGGFPCPVQVTRLSVHSGIVIGPFRLQEASLFAAMLSRIARTRCERGWRTPLCAAVAAGILALPAAASPATRYVAPTGADGAACTASAPCKSFDRAYQVAQPGDVVEVADGTYGSQTVN